MFPQNPKPLQLHQYQFQLTCPKSQLKLKTPSPLLLIWKTGKHSVQTDSAVPPQSNGVIPFNCKLKLVCELGYNEQTKTYLEKRSFVSVYRSEGRLLGVVAVDLARCINGGEYEQERDYRIDRCVDRASTMTFSVKGRFLKEVKVGVVGKNQKLENVEEGRERKDGREGNQAKNVYKNPYQSELERHAEQKTQLIGELQRTRKQLNQVLCKLTQTQSGQSQKNLILLYLQQKVTKLRQQNQHLQSQLFKTRSQACSTDRANRILNQKLVQHVSNQNIMRKLSQRVITISLENKSLEERLKKKSTLLEKTSRAQLSEENEMLFEKIDGLEDQVFELKQREERLRKEVSNLNYQLEVKEERHQKQMAELNSTKSETQGSVKAKTQNNEERNNGTLFNLLVGLGSNGPRQQQRVSSAT